MFVKLEQTRLEFDEHMIEMENRRLREDRTREERERKEDQEFQLKMMLMKQQEGMRSLSSSYNSSYDYSTHASSSSQQWPESDF